MIEMAQSVDFWLCGQFRMRSDGEVLVLRRNLTHELLALLLLRANVAVPIEDLVGSLWPGHLPRGGEDQIRPYISRLRKQLVPIGVELKSDKHRYRLQVEPARVDVLRFRALVAATKEESESARQCQLIDAALAVCPTDELLTDFSGEWARTARVDHQLIWEDVALRRNRFWLQDGRHDQLVTMLRETSKHRSSNQRWVEDYLLALHRAGRVEEALSHFAAFEAEVGAIGGRVNERLRNISGAIRRQDPELDQPDSVGAAAAPDTLPPRRGGVVGRFAEIRKMRVHAETSTHDSVRVIGVYGPPGIGKSTLAIEFAYAHRGRYPGGVLYADFGAFSTGSRNDTHTILATFLGAFGVTGNLLPADYQGRLSRYRELVRRRPVLVVLDNVAASRDAEPLLPIAAGSVAIVASRHRLTHLTSRYGALAIVLGRIDDASGVQLLRNLIGERADRASTIVKIAAACGGHPLALCLAGARIATRPEESLEAVSIELADPGRRIAALERYAEAGESVADIFGWSYQTLGPIHANVFRLLGLSPCGTLDLPMAARLTGMEEGGLTGILADLAGAHLVTPVGPDRYMMLDLLAEYAVALSESIDEPSERKAALDRLYGFHRTMAWAAAHRLWPMEIEAPSVQVFPDGEAARGWLDEHRDDLLQAVWHRSAVSRPGHLLDLAAYLFRYLDHGGWLDEATRLNELAVTIAARDGLDIEHGHALARLGAVLVRRGRPTDAQTALDRSRIIFERHGDRRGQALALGNLGRLAARNGDYAQAERHHSAALDLYRACGHRIGEARTLTNLGIVCEARGNLVDALANHVAAQAICLTIDAPDAHARAVASIAGVYRRQGRLPEAEQFYQEALDHFEVLGDRVGYATTLTNLGIVRTEGGGGHEAVTLHEQALKIFEEAGDTANAVETLNNLGDSLLAAARITAAINRYGEALSSAQAIRDRSEATRAATGLAIAHTEQASRTTRDERAYPLAAARHHLRSAIDGYRELGVPVVERLDEVARRLAEF